ncbi:MAG: 2-oxoglutarate dehydrogenase complex dihydrolipoyllysine-residue succinyltransferase [Chloroflexi bacterium]|nr:2-oxoglutarate dehydrogenase complex dihydrolipoyllysine-residue succinyltransferase [Chloroflexota bacterium]
MTSKIIVPSLGESVVEATVARWLKNEGERVAVGQAIVVLETDKVDLEVGAEKDGVLAKIERPAGADVKIGDVLGYIEEVAPGIPAVSAPAPAAATPVAKRVAEEYNVDLALVTPSTGGKVTKGDVEQFVQRAAPPAAPVSVPAAAPVPPPLAASLNNGYRREERVRMSRRRQTIARRLVEAQHTAAMLTTFNEIDMSAVQEVRARRKEAFQKKYNVSLGLSSFFVKAAIGALKLFPRVNAEIQGDEFVLKHYYDIGIAIGAEEGLVVPVLRDADRMSFAEIEKAIKDFAKQSEDGTLKLEALRGGSFTITNGGIFGSLMSTPILNAPQVGILGLHAIKPRPVVVKDQIVIRPMMYVALSYDHRIIDGREAVQFLVRVKELVEDPESLLIEG